MSVFNIWDLILSEIETYIWTQGVLSRLCCRILSLTSGCTLHKAGDAGVIATRGARQVTQASVWILNTKSVSLSEIILNRDQAYDFIMSYDPQ